MRWSQGSPSPNTNRGLGRPRGPGPAGATEDACGCLTHLTSEFEEDVPVLRPGISDTPRAVDQEADVRLHSTRLCNTTRTRLSSGVQCAQPDTNTRSMETLHGCERCSWYLKYETCRCASCLDLQQIAHFVLLQDRALRLSPKKLHTFPVKLYLCERRQQTHACIKIIYQAARTARQVSRVEKHVSREKSVFDPDHIASVSTEFGVLRSHQDHPK